MVMDTNNSILWIAWERQRRSTILAEELKADLRQLECSQTRILRYFLLSIKTIAILAKGNYKYIFVQNPSIVLSFLITFLNFITRKWVVIVDSHTPIVSLNGISNRIFCYLTGFIYTKANLVIVTNSYLKEDFKKNYPAGKFFVLPDKIPDFGNVPQRPRLDQFSILLICSYANDEPYNEAFQAVKDIPQVTLFVTGNKKKASWKSLKEKPTNVVLTGFIPDQDYLELLHSVDIVMDLTTKENCMVCGAYEAIAAGKPLILSKTKILKEYFNQGVVHSENNKRELKNAVLDAISKLNFYQNGIKLLRRNRKEEWLHQFLLLRNCIGLIDFKEGF